MKRKAYIAKAEDENETLERKERVYMEEDEH